MVYNLGSVWSGNRTFPGLGVGPSRVRVPDLIRSDLRTFTGREDGGAVTLFRDGHFRPNLPEADRESGYGVLLSIFLCSARRIVSLSPDSSCRWAVRG